MDTVVINSVVNPKDLDLVFNIRQIVFIVEQKVDPKLEYDGFEKTAKHFLARVNNISCGTARWRETEKGIKLERFAVLKNYRKKGVGAALIKSILAAAPRNKPIYLHAQIHVVDFYKKFGFIATGPSFVEANIVHYKMTKNI